MYDADCKPPGFELSNFLGQLQAAASTDAAMDVLAETTRCLGFRRVCYSFLERVRDLEGRWASPPLLTRGYPGKWDRGWSRHSANDPYLHACFAGGPIVEWGPVQGQDLSASEQDAWHYLADVDLSRGVTVPIHLPGGRFAFVSALDGDGTRSWEEIAQAARPTLFVVAHHFHHKVFSKFNNPFPRSPASRLSAREIECLTWTARGKTVDDIACILERSSETIRIHLKRAGRKLDAINKAHAVAKACHFGLIEIT